MEGELTKLMEKSSDWKEGEQCIFETVINHEIIRLKTVKLEKLNCLVNEIKCRKNIENIIEGAVAEVKAEAINKNRDVMYEKILTNLTRQTLRSVRIHKSMHARNKTYSPTRDIDSPPYFSPTRGYYFDPGHLKFVESQRTIERKRERESDEGSESSRRNKRARREGRISINDV